MNLVESLPPSRAAAKRCVSYRLHCVWPSTSATMCQDVVEIWLAEGALSQRAVAEQRAGELLVAHNHDVVCDPPVPTALSAIDFENGLPAGEYIVALGGFNTLTDNDSEITPGDVGGAYGDAAGHLHGRAIAAGKMAYVGFSIGKAGIPGDFNFHDSVTGDDFLIWQRGESPDPLSGSDLADWEANFGSLGPGQLAGSAPEPEPVSMVPLLCGVGAAGICARRPGA